MAAVIQLTILIEIIICQNIMSIRSKLFEFGLLAKYRDDDMLPWNCRRVRLMWVQTLVCLKGH